MPALIAVMPRAGGDYVWQTRVLDGLPGIVTGRGHRRGRVLPRRQGAGARTARSPSSRAWSGSSPAGSSAACAAASGFVLAATGWWFILALWAPIYGAILKIEFFQPLAALLGLSGGVEFFGSDNGTLVVSIIVIALTSGLVALGMAGYARIQRCCLYLGLIGFAIMAVLMLVSSQDRLQGRIRPREHADVRRRRRLRQDHRRRGGERRVHRLARSAGDGQRSHGDARRRRRDAPVHAVLDPVPELGLDPLRRGPRVRATSARSSTGCSAASGSPRSSRSSSSCSPPRRSAGCSSTPRTSTSSTGSTGTRRPIPTVPIWSYPPLLASYLIDSTDLPDRDGRPVRGVVPGLVRDAVPVVDADDLRRGVRPDPARSARRRCPRAAAFRSRPAVHHGPGDRRERRSTRTPRTSGR